MLLRLVVLLLALVLWPIASACGQTFYEKVAPALSREDYNLIASRLALTKEQREAADRLYEGYVAEHQRNAAAYKKAFKDIEKAKKTVDGETVIDPADSRAFSEAITRYEEQKPGAQRAFLNDVHAMLESTQEVDWAPVERFIRRQMMNALSCRGAVEWQRPDLVRGLFLLKLPAEAGAKVRPLVDEYELLVDKPLRRMEPIQGARGEEPQRVWQAAVLEIRSVNRRYLRLISQELTPEAAARLNAWARRLAYWQLEHWDGDIIYEGVSDAKKLGTVTDEQRVRIEALIAEMEKATAELRKQAEPAYDEADEKMMRMSDKDYEAAMEREDNPLVQLSMVWETKYDELHTEWMARLEQILSEEQRKKAWPPTGKLLDAVMERARKKWE